MSRGPRKTIRDRREVNGVVERRCRRCDEWKPLALMTKDKLCVDGRAPRCKSCENARWELNKMRREERERERQAG